MEESGFAVSNLTETITELVTTWGIKVVGALAVLIVGMIVARSIRGAARRALGRAKLDPTLIPPLSGIIYYLVLGCVIIAVLGMFGVQTTSFIAVLGAAGLAVGLALQGTLSNFAAGVMLLVFRPFRVDDFVEAAGVSGTVKEIGMFSTTLASPDNVRIIVPNGEVFNATIKNYSANDTRRIDLTMGVAYDDDLQVVADTIEKVVRDDDRVLADPAMTIAVHELADSSVNFVVRPWCKREDYWSLRWDLTRRLKERLEAAGCTIPFPQRDVHLHRTDESAA